MYDFTPYLCLIISDVKLTRQATELQWISPYYIDSSLQIFLCFILGNLSKIRGQISDSCTQDDKGSGFDMALPGLPSLMPRGVDGVQMTVKYPAICTSATPRAMRKEHYILRDGKLRTQKI